ncbi:hypothetical protein DBV05_g10114 [Lasiodiplodia theobromae]|uniref:RelA/SpoT domain-containing protein n=1 Tax=Lasiodiplodia theobromae TaxID=45133 RepID=A0A5N5D1B4_9PEZI|nr:hypothetical protein DBV05_g10114 [Lasiodiplodia theobromae]
MKNYQRDFGEYTTLADDFKFRCEQWLEGEALLSNVKSRAKDPGSLRAKLLKRYNERPEEFNSEEDIMKYIVDLSGVRIALYDPRHKERVKSFLYRTFSIKDVIEHPKEAQENNSGRPEDYRRRFNGYAATHYHAVLKEQDRTRRWRPDDKVEIQVMTVLHSVWSEIEHNIVYKQLSGSPSRTEQQLLDGLNGLVNLGELYMENFNTAYDERVKNKTNEDRPFANRYQLGSFLYSELCDTYKLHSEDFTLSSVEILRLFLELPCVSLDTPAKLTEMLPGFDFSKSPEMDTSRDRKRPNASLVIMAALYSTQDLETSASLQTDQSTDERCRIMMSTIITLDEMFAPFNCWERQFTDPSAMGHKPHERLEQLEWLMHDEAPRTMILDGYSLEDSDEFMVDSLWDWFENHPKEMVRFVFNTSRLGVVRDLRHEISLLERIWRMFESLHQGY